MSLYEKLADSHPALRAGLVRCVACGREERVDAAACLATGWPKCCGYTMTLETCERTASVELCTVAIDVRQLGPLARFEARGGGHGVGLVIPPLGPETLAKIMNDGARVMIAIPDRTTALEFVEALARAIAETWPAAAIGGGA